jgi:hypothetical protein
MAFTLETLRAGGQNFIESTRLRSVIWLYAAILIGLALRIVGIRGDLWLDEIWSLNLVQDISFWGQIFTNLDSDNNHPLNSLQLYLVGADASDWHYRLVPLLYSLFTLQFVYMILRDGLFGQISKQAQALVLSVFSLSFFLVLYGTEARGYSGLIMAIVASIYLREKAGRLSIIQSILFYLIIIFGALSHYSFLQFLIGLLIYKFASYFFSKNKNDENRKILFLDLPALLMAGALYLARIQYLSEGSGNLGGRVDVIVNALSLLSGGPLLSAYSPLHGVAALCYALLSLILIIFSIIERSKRGDSLWFFFFVVIFVVPTTVIILFDPRVLFVRYFLPSMLLALFSNLIFLARLYDHGKAAKRTALLIFGLLILGNIWHLQSFLRFKRGQYSQTLQSISDISNSHNISYSSDQEFRNSCLINYHRKNIDSDKVFAPQSIEASCPEWYIKHSQDLGYVPAQKFSHCQSQYDLKIQTNFAAESGWRWFWYQKE